MHVFDTTYFYTKTEVIIGKEEQEKFQPLPL
jgi:hypothetical protein